MTLDARWIEGHAIIPEWPVRGGAQRVVSADEAERAIAAQCERLQAVLAVARRVADTVLAVGQLVSQSHSMLALSRSYIQGLRDALDEWEKQQ